MLHSRKKMEESEKEYKFAPDSSTTPLFGSYESAHLLPRESINDKAINPNVAYQLISDEMMHDGNPRYNLATFVQTYMEPEAILPRESINDKAINPNVAYQLISDEMMHDGNPRYNLATFVQTYMEPEAKQVMVDAIATNAIDKAEYPQTTEVEKRCVNIIADLWHAPKDEEYMGTSTVGSSEACMLGGMAMKFRWRKRAQALGIDINAKKPNLVVSSGFQVVWEKFGVYWDVELREVPMMSLDDLRLDPKAAVAACDEYTIGIVPIMGITYTGTFDDIVALDKEVEEYNKTAKLSVPIHVDAASGGLYLPFVNPELPWDFRLKNVVSISTSGHKFGLVYPGLGWVMWRDKEDKEYLPEELLFKVAYLGAFEPTFQINFSRPGSQIWAQYYNFVRWGKEGYKAVHERSRDVGLFLTKGLEKLGVFKILNSGENIPIVCWMLNEDEKRAWTEYDLADRLRYYGWQLPAYPGVFKILNSGENIPIVCWMLNEDEKRAWTEYDLADRLRYYGWQLPAYPLPKNLEDVSIMRVVVRADQSMEQMSLLLRDMKESIDYLNQHVTEKKVVKKTEDHVAGYSHTEKRLLKK